MLMRCFFLQVALILLTPSLSRAQTCQDLFHRPRGLEVQYGPVKIHKNHDRFGVEVPSHSYLFDAYLNSDGILHISAFLAFPEMGVRSHLNGALLYSQMMTHFGPERINAINGRWVDGTNLEQYFSGIQQGLSPEAAALATWSGRQAQLYGFARVRSIEVLFDKLVGTETVSVVFERP